MNLPTWCPECGPKVDINEDGCCVTCGASATGRGAVAAHLAIIERDEAQEAYREARASRWHVSKKWDEALNEIERLRTENRDMSRAITDAIEIQRNACTDAYHRGAEAMRKRCEELVKHNSHEDGIGMGSQRIESAIRALRIPEEP